MNIHIYYFYVNYFRLGSSAEKLKVEKESIGLEVDRSGIIILGTGLAERGF